MRFPRRRYSRLFCQLCLLATGAMLSGQVLSAQYAYAQEGLAPLEDFDYWLRLCQLQTTAENYEGAQTSCEQAIVLRPKDDTLWTVHSEILLNLEQYPEAIVSAERAIALNADNTLALGYQCQAYSALRQTELALTVCDQATVAAESIEETTVDADSPEETVTGETLLEEVIAVTEAEETLLEALAGETEAEETAEETLEAIAEETLENAPDLAVESEGSEPTLESAEEISPPSLSVLALRDQGAALEAAEEFEAALEIYEQLQLMNPADSISLAYKCRTQVSLRLYEKAVATCQQAIDGDRQWTPAQEAFAFYHKGLAYAGAGEHQQAVEAFDQVLAISPEDIETWIAQGVSLQAQKQSVAALTSYSRAVELDPMSSRSLLGQCIAYNYLADHESAAAACQQAIQGDRKWFASGEAEAWNQWGRALAGQNMQAEALAALDRAIGMRPNYAEAWSNQSVVHWYLGNAAQEIADIRGAIAHYSSAIAAIEQTLEITANDSADAADTTAISSPDDTQRKVVRAYAYANLGRYQNTLAQLYSQQNSPQTAAMHFTGALTAYNQALALTPEDTETLVNKSVVLWFFGDYEAAQASASRAISLDPTLVAAWQSQAAALVALGDYPAARVSYEQVLIRDRENADAWAGLGVVSLQLEERDVGIAALQKALEINPAQPVALRAIALLEEAQRAEEAQQPEAS